MSVTTAPRPPAVVAPVRPTRGNPRWMPWLLALGSLLLAVVLKTALGGGPITTAAMAAVLYVGSTWTSSR